MNINKILSPLFLSVLLTACGGEDGNSTPNSIPTDDQQQPPEELPEEQKPAPKVTGALQFDTSSTFYAAYRFIADEDNEQQTDEWQILEPKLHTLKGYEGKNKIELVTMCLGEGGPDWTVVRATLDRGVGVPSYRCYQGKSERNDVEVRFTSANEDISLLRGHTTLDYQSGVHNSARFDFHFEQLPETFDAVFLGANKTTKSTYLYRENNMSAEENEFVYIDFTDSEKVTELPNSQEYLYNNDRYGFDMLYRYPTQQNNRGLSMRTVGALSSEQINYAIMPAEARIEGDFFSQFWKGESYDTYELNRITLEQIFEPNIPAVIQPKLADNITLTESGNLKVKTLKSSDEFTNQAVKVWVFHQYENQYINSINYYAYNENAQDSIEIEPLDFNQLPELDVNLLLADIISKDDEGNPKVVFGLPPTTLSTEIIYQAVALFATETYPAIDSALLTIHYQQERQER